MSEHVVVYGSLRKGLWGYLSYLTPLEPITTSRVRGFNMFTVEGRGYPFIMQGDGVITVEVYQIDSATLARLDEFEDYPTLYDRLRITVEGIEAWIYTYAQLRPEDRTGLTPVEGGDWIEYASSRNIVLLGSEKN